MNRQKNQRSLQSDGNQWKFYHPKELVELLSEEDLYRNSPLSLKYQKYVRSVRTEEKTEFIMKKFLLEYTQEEVELYKRFLSRYKQLTEKKFSMRTKTKLIVGLGNPSVYEVSISLHRLYSVPVIPGSAIKGVTRYYYLQLLCEELQHKNINKSLKVIEKRLEAEKITSEDNDFINTPIKLGNKEITFEEAKKIFGTQSERGYIVFFDALPDISQSGDLKSILEFDIMTPHYSRYYSSTTSESIYAPGDWDNPIPIKFIVVKKGVSFFFSLGVKYHNKKSNTSSNLLDKAVMLTQKALKEIGIGGKTAVNYGYFE
ncbi:MAG: type III-B CRISPR module RAMP protein Cmr6 [Candidatus Odinarchaeota archaeon]|nr:type III-B CRISPR module RAMP protein Cmr6 [Candidatus Odinarchaeota archaeon]